MITLAPDLDKSIQLLGWKALTPIQELAIPLLRAGRDVLAQAQTGTGKTGAFGRCSSGSKDADHPVRARHGAHP